MPYEVDFPQTNTYRRCGTANRKNCKTIQAKVDTLNTPVSSYQSPIGVQVDGSLWADAHNLIL